MRLHLTRLEARDTPATLPANFSEVPLGEGIQSATTVAVAPNGDAWVLEQTGAVKRFRPGSTTADVVATLPVDSAGERGLLGIAFDPNYATNKYVYLYHTVAVGFGTQAANRVTRFTVLDSNPADYTVDLNSQRVIVSLEPLSTATNHNGGDLAFGTDGKLYVAVGDNNDGANSQNLLNRLGKVLRVNPDGSIPADNPTTIEGISGTTAGLNRAIFAAGFRNPFRIAVRPGSGQIFVNDVGGALFEEVNELRAGANYGWPQTEGNVPPSQSGVTYPVYAYAHGTGPLQGNVITGGAFYSPATSAFPAAYRNDYFFADGGTGRIYVRDNFLGVVDTFATDASLPVDLAVTDDGRLLYLSRIGGRLMAVSYTPSLAPAVGLSAVGSGAGAPAQVLVRNADNSPRFTLTPYGAFAGGVRVAVADVTGDGSDDILTAAGPGGGPHVKVFDGRTGAEVSGFFAYDAAFTGGVWLAGGDVDGDGWADIITGAGAGGGPHVKAFSGQTGRELQSFFAYAPAFSGGVSVAAGDLDGDGRAEIVTGAGAGGGPHVKAFRASDLVEVRSFFAFDPAFTGGVNVTAGDTDGDRKADVIAAPASGGNAEVRVFRTTETVSVTPFDARFQGGVRVGFSNGRLLVGAGPGGGPHVRVLGVPAFNEVAGFFAFDPAFAGGVSVG